MQPTRPRDCRFRGDQRLLPCEAAADLRGLAKRSLLARMPGGVASAVSGGYPALSGSAFRPVERDGARALDVWREPMAVGQPLPTLPLWLRGGPCLAVELEATYQRTCIEQRVQPAA
jgi:hypothetical protein